MSALCPFRHSETHLIEEVLVADLISAYRDRFGAAVDAEFGTAKKIEFRECTVCSIKFFDPPVAGSEGLYMQLSRFPWYYMADKHEFRHAARRITAGQRVLEIGCGIGNFASYLTDCRYTGLESNSAARASAQSRGLDVRSTDLREMADLHIADFDVVCAFQVLEHVSEPALFIRSCAECTRPGGMLMFGVPNAGAYPGLEPDEPLNMPPHHLTWWNEETFWRIAPLFGLEMIAVEAMPLTELGTFSRIVVLNVLRRKLGVRSVFFFRGTLYRLLNRLAVFAAPAVLRGMQDPRLLPRGHTILAILRKPTTNVEDESGAHPAPLSLARCHHFS